MEDQEELESIQPMEDQEELEATEEHMATMDTTGTRMEAMVVLHTHTMEFFPWVEV